MKARLTWMIGILILATLLSAWSVRKPKILIIGDSISIGYTPFVKQFFADTALVVHNPGNAEHTGTGLEKIREWIGDGDWDIVQFNWGLWDLCYRDPASTVQGNRDKVNGRITWTVEEYRANLDSLVTILQRSTKARLIFVTTTYVPENEAGRFQEDVLKYNDAAKKVMEKHSVKVNDIYEESRRIQREYGLGPDNVHYSKEGYRALAELIIDYLKISKQNQPTD
jgi:lysophospholipase L1-like esterase